MSQDYEAGIYALTTLHIIFNDHERALACLQEIKEVLSKEGEK